MPTFDQSARFRRKRRRLHRTESERAQMDTARRRFLRDIRDMEAGRRSRFRRSLRVKGVKGAPGVFEMTWAPDGRATFSWGDEVVAGQRHIIWRRCGDHEILKDP